MESAWHDFEIIREIGRGGMGIVYQAHQRTLQRKVALKMLLAEKVSLRQKRRFAQEIELSARLQHPNIVKIYAADISGANPYIAMQYIEGKPLKEYVQQKQPALNELLAIIATVADALHYTHQQGVVHRDIKPGNILITEDGTPYVTDFGLARSTRIEDRSLTRTGEILGTPLYMAPEQAKGNRRDTDHRTDIYALGAILYEIATGITPIQDESPITILFKLVNERPPAPRTINPKISDSLEAIIIQAMAYKKQHRYACARELAADLRRFIECKPVKAHRLTLLMRIVRYYPQYLLGGAIAVAIIFLLVVGWNLFKVNDADSHKRYYSQALKAYNDRQYSSALRYLHYAANFPGAENLRMLIVEMKNVPRLEQEKRFDQMRLALARICELANKASEFEAIGNKALQYGYFKDARRYFEQALANDNGNHLYRVGKSLAQTLLHLGQFSAAENMYKQMKETAPEVLLGMAYISYHRRQYPQVTEYLRQIPEKCALSPWWRAQKLLLRLLITWEAHPDIGRWHWLSSPHRECEDCKQILQIFQRGCTELRELQRYLQSCAHTHILKLLRNKIDLYLLAANLECATNETAIAVGKIKKLQQALRQIEMPANTEVFFSTVIIRALIRYRLWDKAYQASIHAIDKFPWVAALYPLRAIAKFHLGDLQGMADDTLYTIRLDRWSFIALENLTTLFLDRFTQEEFQTFSKTYLNYVYSSTFDLQREILAMYTKKLMAEMRGLHKQSPQIRRSTNRILWQTMLESPSPGQRQLAMDILAADLDNPSLKQKLIALDKRYSQANSKRRQIVADFKKAIANNKSKKYMQQLRHILMRYSISADKHYTLQVYRNRQQALPKLKKLMGSEDELPIIRLLAAQMLMAMNRKNHFDYLHQLVATASFPLNLLAAVAIRSTGIGIALPQLPERICDARHGRFYRLLLALHVHPYIDRSLYQTCAQKLLTDDDDLVVLCAAYNFRRYSRVFGPPSSKDIQKNLVRLCNNPSVKIRTLALRTLWRFDDLLLDTKYQQQRDTYFDQKLLPRCWAQATRKNTLLAAITSSDREVQLAVLQIIVGDDYLRHYISFSKQSAFLQELSAAIYSLYTNSKFYVMRYWCASALAIVDKSGKIWEIVNDVHNTTMLRYAILIQFSALHNVRPEQFQHLLRILTTPHPKEKKDFKQLLYLSYAELFSFIKRDKYSASFKNRPDAKYFNAYRSTFKAFFKIGLKSSAAGVQRAAIASLATVGDMRDMENILPHLHSSDRQLQRTTVCTIAQLTAEYSPQRLPQVQQMFRRLDSPIVLKAAAFGYYRYVCNNIYYPTRMVGNLDFNGAYDLYIEHLRHEIKTVKPGKLRQWLQILEYANKLYPTPKYHYEAALILRQLNEPSKAISQLQRGAKLIKQSIRSRKSRHRLNISLHIHLLLAQLRIEQQRYPAAAKILHFVVNNFPLFPKPHYFAARLNNLLGKPEQARRNFWAAYLCDPMSPQALFAMAKMFFDKKKPVQALKLARYSCVKWKMRRTFSMRITYYRLQVKKSIAKQRYARSCLFLQKILREWPLYVRFRLLIAEHLQSLGKTLQAQQHLYYAYLIDPYHKDILVKLVQSYVTQKKFSRAIAVCKEMHKKFPLRRRDFAKDQILRRLKEHWWVRKLPR